MRASTVINKAGGDVLKRLEALDQKVKQMRQEQITQFNAVDCRFTMLEEGASHLLTSVKNLSVEMVGTRQALFAQHSRVKLSNRTDLLRRCLDRVMTEIAIADDEVRIALKEEAKKLMQDIDKIEKEVEEQDDLITSSLGLPAIYPSTITPNPIQTTPTRPTTPTTPRPIPRMPIPSMLNQEMPVTPTQSEMQRVRLNPSQSDTSAQGSPQTLSPVLRNPSASNMNWLPVKGNFKKVTRSRTEEKLETMTHHEMNSEEENDREGSQIKRQKRTESEVMDTDVNFLQHQSKQALKGKKLTSASSYYVRLPGLTWSLPGSNTVLLTGIWLKSLAWLRYDLMTQTVKSKHKKPEPIPRHAPSCTNFHLGTPSLLLVLLCLLILYPITCLAVAPTMGLNLFALNANGMNNVLKVQHINTAIRTRNLSVFVISELKSKVPVTGKLPGDCYNMFEEKSEPTDGTWKWGMIVGIRKDLQIVQRIQVPDRALQGRILVVDILLPSSDGRAFPHRIYGVYGPWDPGSKTTFWQKMTEVCRNCPHSWSMIGDLNVTTSPLERANPENRTAYLTFLQETGGKDIWRKYSLRNRLTDWTCKAKDSLDGGSIIDRLVTSGNGIIEANVQVANNKTDYVPVTDHRPIIALVIPDTPGGSIPRRSQKRVPPRLIVTCSQTKHQKDQAW